MSSASALSNELVIWLSDYLHKSGKSGFVLGMSGGLDSSVLALVAREAVARTGQRLLALILPIDDDYYDESTATQVCEQFDIDYQVIDLKPVCEIWRDILPETKACPVVYTNLKARTRETALYHRANSDNLLVLGTVNKGELMIGYFPKNASAGDVLPLADLLKSEIRELGRHYGMPEHVVTAKASGCIWARTAEEEWGFTENDLDQMIVALHHGGPDAVQRLPGIAQNKAEHFVQLHAESAHKRAFYPIFRLARA